MTDGWAGRNVPAIEGRSPRLPPPPPSHEWDGLAVSVFVMAVVAFISMALAIPTLSSGSSPTDSVIVFEGYGAPLSTLAYCLGPISLILAIVAVARRRRAAGARRGQGFADAGLCVALMGAVLSVYPMIMSAGESL